MTTQLYVYDFTLSVAKSTDDHTEIVDILNQLAKKWCFQKEDSRIIVEERHSDSEEDYDDDDGAWSDFTDYADSSSEESDDSEYNFTEEITAEDGVDELSNFEPDDENWSDVDQEDEDGVIHDGSEYDSDVSEDESEGYIHWQGRISLIKKKRLQELVKLCKMSNFYRFHWSPTSKEVSDSGNLFYVQKADSRIDGPWSNIDPEPSYIPRQIRMITELRPWQQEIVDSLSNFDTRTINVIYDKCGNIGKSTLSTYCGVHGLALSIPPLDNYKDIMNMVMDRPVSTAYFIDMPRSLPKAKLWQFYSGLEELKNGHAWDARYHYKERYFDCPNVWIFTNVIPDKDLLTRDRWVVWEIRDNLLEYYGKPDRVREVVLPIEWGSAEDEMSPGEEEPPCIPEKE